MELCEYYNLDECVDLKSVLNTLKVFKKDGKIDFSVDGEILKIDDLDLDESEISKIINIFEKNDIFENLDYEDDDEDWSDWSEDDEY